jgi:hypothetical protein
MLLTLSFFTQACFQVIVMRGKLAQQQKKLWTNFKIHVSAAHHEFRLTNKTAQQSGSHSANMMIKHHPYQVMMFI